MKLKIKGGFSYWVTPNFLYIRKITAKANGSVWEFLGLEEVKR